MPSPLQAKPLRIAVIAHLRHPIAAPFMGGMEAHCETLTRGLVAAGHDVTLFASGDSDGDLPVRAVADASYEKELPWAVWHGTSTLRDWLARAYRRCWQDIFTGEFDLVHNNSLFPDLLDWASRDGIAMVTSLHIPPFEVLADAVARNSATPWQQFTICSEQQRHLWPAVEPRVAWNGIAIDRWPFAPASEGRAIWVGRITPTKGTLEAIAAAEEAGVPLDIIGPIDCRDYWAEVRVRLRGPHRYLGHLSGAALTTAVQQASVMIATPMWDEPFGLTMVEAMACGVPVAGLARGAIPEVVGEAGAVVDRLAALPSAICRAVKVARTVPRQRVERHFTVQAMIARYGAAYASATAGLAAASSCARTRELLA